AVDLAQGEELAIGTEGVGDAETFGNSARLDRIAARNRQDAPILRLLQRGYYEIARDLRGRKDTPAKHRRPPWLNLLPCTVSSGSRGIRKAGSAGRRGHIRQRSRYCFTACRYMSKLTLLE